VNDRLIQGRGRFAADPNYKAFKISMAWELSLKMETFTGPVSVRLTLELNKKMDTDSVIKPCLDALEEAGVVKNDKQVRIINVFRKDRTGDLDEITFNVREIK
ncbi:unnamed protein product, partial [marine sediment metagenome]